MFDKLHRRGAEVRAQRPLISAEGASGVGKAAPAGRNAIAELEDRVTKAGACTASPIATFGSGLDSDGTAVRAALTEPWSSGRTKGQINRLRLIKRQSDGRAGLDLLQRRMVPAA